LGFVDTLGLVIASYLAKRTKTNIWQKEKEKMQKNISDKEV